MHVLVISISLEYIYGKRFWLQTIDEFELSILNLRSTMEAYMGLIKSLITQRFPKFCIISIILKEKYLKSRVFGQVFVCKEYVKWVNSDKIEYYSKCLHMIHWKEQWLHLDLEYLEHQSVFQCITEFIRDKEMFWQIDEMQSNEAHRLYLSQRDSHIRRQMANVTTNSLLWKNHTIFQRLLLRTHQFKPNCQSM